MSLGHAYVINIRDGLKDLEGEVVVRVDRTHPVLGNHEFKIQRRGDPAERKRVLSLFEEKLQEDLASDGPRKQVIEGLALDVAQGKTVALQCWCSPLPCHADFIANAVNDLARQKYRQLYAENSERPKP